jgi:hypothetical protein
MEYSHRICIEREEFHDLLTSGHDCATFLNISLFVIGILGFSLVGSVHFMLSLQKEFDGLVQVKKSLMEHIVTLEEELTETHAHSEKEDTTETKPHVD